MNTVLRPNFGIITGIDLCGKGTIFKGITEILDRKEIKYLDLRKMPINFIDLRSTGDLPLNKYKVILTREPTEMSILEREMFKESGSYTTRQFVEAFAQDRMRQYLKVVLPALEAGLVVLQDRGFTDSLVYQTVQARERGETDITLDFIASLMGNKIALENPPGLILIPTISAMVANERRGMRTEKQDAVEFEKGKYPELLARAYHDDPKDPNFIGWKSSIPKSTIIEVGCDSCKDDVIATQKRVISNIAEYYKSIGVDLFG